MTKSAIKTELQVATFSSHRLDWNAAKRYAKSYREGGFSDWRLPTVDEAVVIVRINPQPNWIWTSTLRGMDEAAAVALSGRYFFRDLVNFSDCCALPVRTRKT